MSGKKKKVKSRDLAPLTKEMLIHAFDDADGIADLFERTEHTPGECVLACLALVANLCNDLHADGFTPETALNHNISQLRMFFDISKSSRVESKKEASHCFVHTEGGIQ